MTPIKVNQFSSQTPTLTINMRKGLTEENQIGDDERLVKKVVEFTKILPELAALVVEYRNSSCYDCFPIGTVLRSSNSLTLPPSQHIVHQRNIFSPSYLFLSGGYGNLTAMIDLNSLKLNQIKQATNFDINRGAVVRDTFIHINSKGRLLYSKLHEGQLRTTANLTLKNLEEDDFEKPEAIEDIAFFFDTPMNELLVASKAGNVLVSRSPQKAKDFYKNATITKTGKRRIIFAKSLSDGNLVVMNIDSLSVWNTSTNKLEHEIEFSSVISKHEHVMFASNILGLYFQSKLSDNYSLTSSEVIASALKLFDSSPEGRLVSFWGPNFCNEITIFSEDVLPRCKLRINSVSIGWMLANNCCVLFFKEKDNGTVLFSYKFENAPSKRSNDDIDSKTNEPPKSHLERYADDSKTNEPPLPRLTISSTTHNEQIEEN